MEWGFAKAQKQKNIRAIHEAFTRIRPGEKVLEISSKSMQENGEDLSAFFLQKYVPSLDKKTPVEGVFQSAKTFEKGGPYKDLLYAAPREAKRDQRLKNSGKLVCFTFEGKEFPLEPTTVFYDYIYLNSLLENESLAKTAAAFVALSRLGLIEQVKDFEAFLKLNDYSLAVNDPHLQKKKTKAPGTLDEDKTAEEKVDLNDVN